MASLKPVLKPIVASLCFLGLVGGSALAAVNSINTTMDNSLMQNRAGGGQLPDWYNRIVLSGQANIDGYIANRSPTIMVNTATNRGANDIALYNASLFVDAKVNEWTNTHVHLLYGQDSPSFLRSSARAGGFGPSAAVAAIDEAIVTIGNVSRTPFYFQAGREYVPFGDYNRYAMTNMVQSLTQLLSMTQATAAQVGFADTSGFNGALYLFRGIQQAGTITANANLTRTQNWGANLAYGTTYTDSGFKIGVGYLNNMADVMYVASSAGIFPLGVGSYINRVGALSADATVNYNMFDGGLHYVTALQTFAAADLPTVLAGTVGAKPKAWGVDLGYSFPTMDHTSRLGVGYQHSSQSSAVGIVTGGTATGMPKNRWLANYVVNISHCTDFGFEIFNDKADQNTVATGQNATAAVVRLGVKWV